MADNSKDEPDAPAGRKYRFEFKGASTGGDGPFPSPELLKSLMQAQAVDLDRAEELPSDETIEAKAAAGRDKAKQTYDFRDRLFNTIQVALVGALGAAVVLMVLYTVSEWGDLDAAVFIGFNAAVVVNTIGLAYVVAKYLFPEGGADRED